MWYVSVSKVSLSIKELPANYAWQQTTCNYKYLAKSSFLTHRKEEHRHARRKPNGVLFTSRETKDTRSAGSVCAAV